MYSPVPDRRALTLAYLNKNKAELQKLAKLALTDKDFGMVGQVRLYFGRGIVAPKDANERMPHYHMLELWWSGQVMPEANGPKYALPQRPGAPDGEWRFHSLIRACSERLLYRE